MNDPGAVIGDAAVARLYLAGYDIVPRTRAALIHSLKSSRVVTFSCPACGYSAQGGSLQDVYADYGEAWHSPCVPAGSASSVRAGRWMRKDVTEVPS